MSTYFQSIQIGVLLFFAFLLVALIPYMIIQYRRSGRVAPWKFLVSFSFVLYLICAYALTIFPLPDPAEVAKFTGPKQNLVPFMFIREFLKNTPLVLTDPHTWLATLKSPSFIQPAFNVLLTVPFGIYMRYLFKRKFTFTLITSFLLTLSFETIQRSALFGLYPRPYRLFDVDDLMLNTLGALIGFGLAYLLRRLLPDLDAVQPSGGKISLTRRSIALFTDFVLFIGLSIFMEFYWSAAIVFIAIPFIFTQSIGQIILRIQTNPKKRLRIALRQLLFLVNTLPYVLVIYLLQRSATIPETELAANFMLMLISLAIGFLPIIDIIIAGLSRSRKLWYERLTKTSLIEKRKNIE
ncbi:MAG: VanZ family protein [Streptococcaceae bacterium]|jgi:glycopeptide antibiotics resistance protein|nr:VanZ family protein [Streptococcaceae bacterium]